MNTLTISQLKAAGACASGIEDFRELFGESADATLENVEKAQAAGLSFFRAASALLTPAAWAEYRKATAAASAEYRKAEAAAWAERDKAIAAARAECRKAIAAALAEYRKATVAASAEYDKATAAAFLAGLLAS